MVQANTAAGTSDARETAAQALSRLADEIGAGTRAALVAAEVHYAEARRVGQLLIEAKDRLEAEVGYGEWGRWVAENFPASPRTARVWMQAAKEPLPNFGSAAELPIRAWLAERKQHKERLRKEAGPKPGEHVRALHGPHPGLPVRAASDLIRAQRGLPPVPLTRSEKARAELENSGPHPAAGTLLEVTIVLADGDGGRSRQVIREGVDPVAAVREALRRAKKGIAGDGRR
jgi:hypothetical protein